MGWMWIIWPLLFLLAIVLVGVFARGSSRSEPRQGPAGDATRQMPGAERADARRILDERYARGEIDDDEYQTRLRHLRGGSSR